MIVYLKKSKKIVSGALLAFVAIVIVVLNFHVLNDASMKLLSTTVISDRRFQPDLSLKRLSRRLSQEKESPKDERKPPQVKKEPTQDNMEQQKDVNVQSSSDKQDISIPFCTWKDSNTTIGDILVNQNTEDRIFHNFSQAYEEQQSLLLCPEHSPLLRGRTNVYQGNITWEQAQVNKTVKYSPVSKIAKGLLLVPKSERHFLEIIKVLQNVQVLHHGGYYVPSSCKARSRVAILIPYRDREEHLIIFLNHIHPILMRQQITYGIYVIEQV